MSNLTQIRDRVEQLLLDTTNAIFTADLIDEAIRQALMEYNQTCPQETETVITLPGEGREVALNNLTGLSQVSEVWWPYDSSASQETWPPNRVRGFRLYWDNGQPVLFLELEKGSQPQQDDELRLWYTRQVTIDGLDSTSGTTLPTEHESLIVIGAAGQAALSRTVDLVEITGSDMYAVGLLGTWGNARLREFRAALKAIRERASRHGKSWGEGWQLDQWDER